MDEGDEGANETALGTMAAMNQAILKQARMAMMIDVPRKQKERKTIDASDKKKPGLKTFQLPAGARKEVLSCEDALSFRLIVDH